MGEERIKYTECDIINEITGRSRGHIRTGRRKKDRKL
jgi:hypothetical protein